MASSRHILNMANSIIGVSILSMPYCFKECGLVLGVILILFCGFITKKTCMFLIKAAIMSRRRSYELLAFQVFGLTGKLVIEMCMILFLIGISISFHVVIGDLAPSIVAKYMSVANSSSLRSLLLIGMMILIIFPLCLLRNLDSLSSMSACSIVFYVFLNCVIISMALPNLFDGSWIHRANLFVPSKAFRIMPIITLGLACQSNVFEIYSSLHDADVFKMKYVVDWAVNICSALYIGFGFFGYIAFIDNNIQGNIILNFPSSVIKDSITSFFVFSLAISFPLMLFPCRTSIHSLLFKRGGQVTYELMGNFMPETRFKAITASVLVFSLVIGILVPDIEFVLGLLGSTMGVAIALAFPSMLFLGAQSKLSIDRLLAQFILLLSICILVTGTYLHLFAIVKPYSNVPSLVTPSPGFSKPDLSDVSLKKIEESVKSPVKIVEDVKKDSRVEPHIPEEPPIIKKPPETKPVDESIKADDTIKRKPAESVPVDASKDLPKDTVPDKPQKQESVDTNANNQKEVVAEKPADKSSGKEPEKIVEHQEKVIEFQNELIKSQKQLIDQLQGQGKAENDVSGQKAPVETDKAKGPAPNVDVPVPNVNAPVSNVKAPVPNVKAPVPNVKAPVPSQMNYKKSSSNVRNVEDENVISKDNVKNPVKLGDDTKESSDNVKANDVKPPSNDIEITNLKRGKSNSNVNEKIPSNELKSNEQERIPKDLKSYKEPNKKDQEIRNDVRQPVPAIKEETAPRLKPAQEEVRERSPEKVDSQLEDKEYANLKQDEIRKRRDILQASKAKEDPKSGKENEDDQVSKTDVNLKEEGGAKKYVELTDDQNNKLDNKVQEKSDSTVQKDPNSIKEQENGNKVDPIVKKDNVASKLNSIEEKQERIKPDIQVSDKLSVDSTKLKEPTLVQESGQEKFNSKMGSRDLLSIGMKTKRSKRNREQFPDYSGEM